MQFRRALFIAFLALAMLGLGRPSLARDYVITSGDQLNIKVEGESDLSRTYTVNDEGKFTMPMINEVVATGKSSDQLVTELTKRLKTYVKDPVVTVEITNPTNTTVWVTGEVTTAGSVKVKPDARLLDVIQQAGGLKDDADKQHAVLFRGETSQVVDLDALMQGDMTKNIVVQYNDRIHIPKNADGKVKVLGEVTTPGEKDLTRKETPMEAITAAGGFKDGADKTHVVLMHKDGSTVNLDMDASSRGEGDALIDNLVLQPDDVIQINNFGKVRVNGDVATPGEKPLTSKMTALEAITGAGGFKDDSDKSNVVVRHADGTEQALDLDAELRGEDSPSLHTYLKPGDAITVSNNKNNQVTVSGPGVKTPGNYTYEPGMTVMEAIGKAGGFADRAIMDRVSIAPKSGAPTLVNLKKYINDGDVSQNVPVVRGSMIYVQQKEEKNKNPNGGLGNQVFGSLIQSLPTLFLYRSIYR